MAVKTITIDMEAYSLLERQKQEGESFSKVIKRRLAIDKTAANLLHHIDALVFTSETLNTLDGLVKDRTKSTTQPPQFG